MRPARILIVDDEVGSSRLLKANLELTGCYEVCVENDSENAVAAARQFRPHLIVADVIMPRMSGACLAAALRADPDLRSIPIVFLTAAERPLMTEETANGLRGFPCISKPASMEDILPHIENNLPP
jgi:two-component system, OmpR family, phosphate regulon response regulator PhoB